MNEPRESIDRQRSIKTSSSEPFLKSGEDSAFKDDSSTEEVMLNASEESLNFQNHKEGKIELTFFLTTCYQKTETQSTNFLQQEDLKIQMSLCQVNLSIVLEQQP